MRLLKLFVAGFLVFTSAGGALYWVLRGLVGPTSSAPLAEGLGFLFNILVASLAGRWWRRVYRTGRGNEGASHRSQPEDEASVAMAEHDSTGQASQMGPNQEAVQPVAKTAPLEGVQIQLRRSDYTAENRMRNRRIGLSAILVGLFFALAPIPFLEFESDHPAPDLEAYIRAGYIEVREAVATPRFATVVKGQENPSAKPVEFEERRPIIEFDTSYSDNDISKVLSVAFPLGAKPLLDPHLERVRFAGWEAERGPVTISYRVLIVAALGLVLLGFGAILWPARPRGSA